MPASMGRDEVLGGRGANTATLRQLRGRVWQSRGIGVGSVAVGWTTGREAGGKEPPEAGETAEYRHRQSSSRGDEQLVVVADDDAADDDDGFDGCVRMKLSDCWPRQIKAT